jgi:hypothetical protein
MFAAVGQLEASYIYHLLVDCIVTGDGHITVDLKMYSFAHWLYRAICLIQFYTLLILPF